MRRRCCRLRHQKLRTEETTAKVAAMAPKLVLTRHALRNLCSPCHTRSHSTLFLDHRPGTSHCWRRCTYYCIAAEVQAASHAPHALRNLCSLCRTRSHSTPFLDHRPGTSHCWHTCMCCSTMWSELTQAEAVFRPLRCRLESELSGDSAQARQSRACERAYSAQSVTEDRSRSAYVWGQSRLLRIS